MKITRIGIDGRMHAHSGIGRYITMLLKHLPSVVNDEPQFVVFSSERFVDGAYRHVATRSRPLSFFEQIDLCKTALGTHLDLFHSPQFNIPLLSKVPQVTTIHDCAYAKYPEEFSSLFDRCLYAVMFRTALVKSRKIIAVSHATKEDLHRIYGVSKEKIRVIHEGVDEVFFESPSNDCDQVKDVCGIDQPFMLFVGIARPRKNLERILRAFAAARGRMDREMKLVIAGPEDTRFLNTRQLIEHLNIGESVILAGSITDQQLRSLYRSTTCFLFPTLHEGFGLPALEAMASGTPVITSRRPAHEEIAGDAALLVDPANTNEMAEAIIRMTEDDRLREEMIQKGLNRARMFSWEMCAAQTLAIYDEVINE